MDILANLSRLRDEEGAKEARCFVELNPDVLRDRAVAGLYIALLAEAGEDDVFESFLNRYIPDNQHNYTAIRSLLRIGRGRPSTPEQAKHYIDRSDDPVAGPIWQARAATLLLAGRDHGTAYRCACEAVRNARNIIHARVLRTTLAGLFSWYGRLDLADRLILDRRSGDAIFETIWDLARMRAAAHYDETTASYFRFLVENDHERRNEAIIAYVHYLWSVDGPNDDLCAHAKRWSCAFKAGDGAYAALRASLHFAAGKRDSAAAILAENPLAITQAQFLPVGLMVAEDADLLARCSADERSAALESAALYGRITAATNELESMIVSIASGLAIVGNSSCEVGQGKGSAIDAKALVFRFNKAMAGGEFKKDYGARTDVHILPTAGNSDAPAAHDSRYVLFTTPYALCRNTNWGHARQIFKGSKSVACIPGNVYGRLARRLGSPPSSGLRVSSYVSEVLKRCLRRDEVFGFAFTDQIGSDALSAHYFEPSMPSMHHNWVKERAIFDRLVRD